MLTDFQHFFTDKLSSKFAQKRQLNIPPHFKRIARLRCEMFVLKNRSDPRLSEANFHARLSTVSQKYSPNGDSIIFVH